MASVERVASLDRADFLRGYLERNRPVVLAGAIADWPALGRWDLDHLRAIAGHRAVQVEEYAREDPLTLWSRPGPRPNVVKTMRFGDYLDTLAEPRCHAYPRYYLVDLDIRHLLPELFAEVRLLGHLDASRLMMLNLYLGHDSASPPHYHQMTEAIISVVAGQKRITLYPPEDTRFLYPKPIYAVDYNQTTVDFSALDLDRFPLVRKTRPLECVLEPGDSLYIPVHWWHLVHGTGLHASVTHFWRGSLRQWNLRVGARTVVAHLLSSGGIAERLLAPLNRRAAP
jgi:hypothetical protein